VGSGCASGEAQQHGEKSEQTDQNEKDPDHKNWRVHNEGQVNPACDERETQKVGGSGR